MTTRKWSRQWSRRGNSRSDAPRTPGTPSTHQTVPPRRRSRRPDHGPPTRPRPPCPSHRPRRHQHRRRHRLLHHPGRPGRWPPPRPRPRASPHRPAQPRVFRGCPWGAASHPLQEPSPTAPARDREPRIPMPPPASATATWRAPRRCASPRHPCNDSCASGTRRPPQRARARPTPPLVGSRRMRCPGPRAATPTLAPVTGLVPVPPRPSDLLTWQQGRTATVPPARARTRASPA